MELRFTSEDETSRQEIRAFYRGELPSDWGQHLDQRGEESSREVQKMVRKKLAGHRWHIDIEVCRMLS